MTISSDLSDEENNILEDNHDRLDLTDQTFELSYCRTCNHSERLIFWEKDQRCKRCDSFLEYQCERCDKLYKGVKALRFHLKHDCARTPGFKCAQCDYKTTRKASLQIHIKCKHTNVTRRHACATCGRLFKHRFHMLTHQRHCGPENNIKCQWCNYTTDSKWGYKQHVRNIHTDPEKLDFYMCITCGKKYKHLNTLRKHRDVCSFKGTCAHCGFQTSLKTSMLKHIKNKHALELFDGTQTMPKVIGTPIEKEIMLKNPNISEAPNKKKKSQKLSDGLQTISKELKVSDEQNFRPPRKKAMPKRYVD